MNVVRRFWGIDPGANGGVACVCLSPIPPYLVERVETLPLARIQPDEGKTRVTGRPTTTLQYLGMDWLLSYGRPDDEVAIERVCAMPAQGRAQGAASSFTFGMNVGVLWGGLEMSPIPMSAVHMVAPQTWKAFFKLSKRPKSDSARLLDLNSRLCPELISRVRPKLYAGMSDSDKLLGEVDALWIALYLAIKQGATFTWSPL
jgi:hypothetical protein